MNRRDTLLSYYEEFPFAEHPFWVSATSGRLSLAQVLKGETQHWLRTRAGQPLRRAAVLEAKVRSLKVWEPLNETYIDECTDEGTENHLALIERLLIDNGVNRDLLERSRNTPGNSAAIAMYARIGSRGCGCHMIGAGAVEYYYSLLCPKIFSAYTTVHQMSARSAETYSLHGPMDQEHANRAFDVLDEVVELDGWTAVEESVRDAFVATSLHYDGMLQAATGLNEYWNGRV